jgi:hypothetical protein
MVSRGLTDSGTCELHRRKKAADCTRSLVRKSIGAGATIQTGINLSNSPANLNPKMKRQLFSRVMQKKIALGDSS